jgi:hypothetical protein
MYTLCIGNHLATKPRQCSGWTQGLDCLGFRGDEEYRMMGGGNDIIIENYVEMALH